MTDRLAELTGGINYAEENDISKPDIEQGELDELDEETRKALEKFQRESDAIFAAIEAIESSIKEIDEKYQVTLRHGTPPDERVHAEDRIALLHGANEKRSQAIRKRLRRIAEENKTFANENPAKTGELKVRVTQHQGMAKRFMSAMQAFEESQERHRDNVKSALERQLRLMNPAASDEEIKQAVRNGDTDNFAGSSQLFMGLSFEEQKRLRAGLEDLQSRNNDIKKLEENIIQLHQLFLDVQILVEAQGELLNNVEYNVESTKGATQAAHEELVEARAHQKSARRKKIWIIVICVAIVVIILIGIFIKYGPTWFPQTKGIVDTITGGGSSNSTSSNNSTNTTAKSSMTRVAVDGRNVVSEAVSMTRLSIDSHQ